MPRRRRGGKKRQEEAPAQPLELDAVLPSNIAQLSVANATTSRRVQDVLELSSSAWVMVLREQLIQHFVCLAQHTHGNHVIQQLIHVSASSQLSWIGPELISAGQDLLTHEFGHRVWMRLLENAAAEARRFAGAACAGAALLSGFAMWDCALLIIRSIS